MQLSILPNHNLKVALDRGEKGLILDLLQRHGDDDLRLLDDLLDQTGLLGNAKLFQVNPSDIGALTCGPIVTDCLEYDEAGTVVSVGNVWWFAGYETRNFARDFLDRGYAVFQSTTLH